MCARAVVRPGTPNDANRDYLPEAIKGTDMVVNENGNNSQPYPARLEECRGVLTDGTESVWYEYVPESYNGTRKVPLVLSMHGGLMSGWGQAIYTCWTQVADREGFIVVFLNASTRKVWTIEIEAEKRDEITTPNEQGMYLNRPPDNVADNLDVRATLGLIGLLKQKYEIDEGRIFMQGMSMGNLMTSQFARHYGHILAGAAGSSGPADPGLLFDSHGSVINQGGSLDIWQSRPELDAVAPHYGAGTQEVVSKNLAYWLAVNHCQPLPQIKIVGENNLAFFDGPAGHVVLRDIKGRDHGQTFDDAELIWDYLFSGVRRQVDGTLSHSDPLLPRTGDAWALAIASGCDQAFFRNQLLAMDAPAIPWQKLKYHGLNGEALVRGEYLYAPLTLLANVFGAKLETSEGGCSATLTLPSGISVQVARGNIGCVIDGRVESMLCEAIQRHGKLYLSLEWFCQRLYNLHVSVCDGVLYATDHDAHLSRNMAGLLRGLMQTTTQA